MGSRQTTNTGKTVTQGPRGAGEARFSLLLIPEKDTFAEMCQLRLLP